MHLGYLCFFCVQCELKVWNESVEPKVTPSPKKKNIFISGLKIAERFIVEHPVESIEIASVVIEVTVKAISSIRGKDVRSRSTKI